MFAAYLLTDDDTAVRLVPRLGAEVVERSLIALDRTVVEVEGKWTNADDRSLGLDIVTVRPAALPAATPKLATDNGLRGGVLGSQRYVTILVRYADSPDIVPPGPDYFRDLVIGTEHPSLDRYWREVSYDNIDLTGSEVVGWYTLGTTRSAYQFEGGYFDFARLTKDAIAAADADVDFKDVNGINIFVDGELDGRAWGGGAMVEADGVARVVGATWLPSWGWANHSYVAHEMGHSFGLPHSRGPYGAVYDSVWDVMSGSLIACNPPDTDFGCVGVHTIACYKDWLGWIPDERRYVAAPNSSQLIDMAPLESPPSGAEYQIAIVPIDVAASQYLTVEVRARTGYDSQLPYEGVIIHRVNPEFLWPGAEVIDQTRNGDPSDEGAVFTLYERYLSGGISIRVAEKTATGYRVEIVRQGGDDGSCASATVPAAHWKGEYYPSQLNTGVPLVVRDDGEGPLRFEPNGQSPAPECGMPARIYRVRWTRVVPLAEGIYRFSLAHGGPVRLLVDGVPIVEDWWSSEIDSVSEERRLSSGDHRIVVEYRQVVADRGMSLVWDDVTRYLISSDSAPVTVRVKKRATVPITIQRRPGVMGAVRVEAPDTSALGLRIRVPSQMTDGNVVRFAIKALKSARLGTHELVFRGVDDQGTVRTTTVRLIVEP